MTQLTKKVDVFLDVHHFMTPQQRQAKRAIRFQDLAQNDALSRVLTYFSSDKYKYMFRLVFTEHHAFNIRRALIEDHGWSKEEAERHVANCRSLVTNTGGDSKSPLTKGSFNQLELARMGGTHLTPDSEDATIVKMAQVLRSDVLVTNDEKLLLATTPGLIKTTIEHFEASIVRDLKRVEAKVLRTAA